MQPSKQPYVLDLFSGLGGASEAFVQAGCQVFRIENNPLLEYVPFTINRDVREWRDWIDELPNVKWDLIWASPPCLEFSNAYAAPGPTAAREGQEFKPDMSLVVAAKQIIEHLKPKWWVIENVAGAIPHFKPLLGEKRQKVASFVLWGSFPLLVMDSSFSHSKQDGDTWSTDPLRPNRRALVPFEISFALMTALREQYSIGDFL